MKRPTVPPKFLKDIVDHMYNENLRVSKKEWTLLIAQLFEIIKRSLIDQLERGDEEPVVSIPYFGVFCARRGRTVRRSSPLTKGVRDFIYQTRIVFYPATEFRKLYRVPTGDPYYVPKNRPRPHREERRQRKASSARGTHKGSPRGRFGPHSPPKDLFGDDSVQSGDSAPEKLGASGHPGAAQDVGETEE